MITLNAVDVKRFAPNAVAQLPGLNKAIEIAQLATMQHVKWCLAQFAHETGGFMFLKELWGPTPAQLRYERDFTAPWPSSPQEAKLAPFAKNRLAYSLGNTEKGDGSKYRGRSDIQTTGRSNYRAVSIFLFKDERLLTNPELLATVDNAPLGGAYYWISRQLNKYVEANDFDGLSDAINIGRKTQAVGDANGYADRVKWRDKADVVWPD